MLNPLRVLEWNTDKQRYFADLADAGVPVVPTSFVPPGSRSELPKAPFVVKPSVSAGGRSSARFQPHEIEAARSLVERIHADGRTAMIQPYLTDAEEHALVYIAGTFSHALERQVPLPSGGDRSVLYLDERLAPATATPEERAIAGAALASAPGELLYARVDLLCGAVLELELVEPSLYLAFGESSAERLARAIADSLARVR